MKYDYLIVGAGLFGAVCAHEAQKKGKKVLVIEKRPHIAGNIYTEELNGIHIHKYGAHIFHTSNKRVWDYVQQFAEFNRYTNAPVARYKGELYNLPFNMNTFHQMWGVITPKEAEEIIQSQIAEANIFEPKNLEEQAIRLVGKDIYEKLVKGYTEKQWGKRAVELPAFIIKRIPVRFTYDNNYFNDLYQGIPVEGYTKMVERMLKDVDIQLSTDFLLERERYCKVADKIIYTGMIDEYFDYCYGALEYRSLNFETETLDLENYQGNAVVNYTEYEVPFTRIIEHKHFSCASQTNALSSNTVITREYPVRWEKGREAYYPVNDEKNNEILRKYQKIAQKERNMIFGGRLGMYQYFDMHRAIEQAFMCMEQGI